MRMVTLRNLILKGCHAQDANYIELERKMNYNTISVVQAIFFHSTTESRVVVQRTTHFSKNLPLFNSPIQ